MILQSLRNGVAHRRQPGNPKMIDGWLNSIQNWLYPPTCLLCGDPGHEDRDLCEPCTRALPWIESACPSCGLPLAAPSPQSCGACQQKRPPFDRLLTVFRYEEPVRHLIQSLKFGARYPNARLLGALLAERVSREAERPEVIIPVPLHASRYRQRGFNQAQDIARIVARQAGIPLDIMACRRVRATEAQAQLDADTRRKNIRKAFAMMSTVRRPYRHVAIVDDVVTTGATVGELAKTLRRAGVETIEVWACARALR